MNYKVKTINNISDKGLDILKNKGYAVGEEESEPDAIILRSHKLQMSEIPSSVKAIVRAGAGVNNIPVEECSQIGIPVFNTPGANANAVKEMVLAALLMSSRGIFDGVKFVHGIEDVSKENLKAHIESGKKSFKGRELKDGCLGVVGMGAIGAKVAEMGVMLGMRVIGFDPQITVEAAWALPNEVERKETIEEIFKESDYVTLHVPANEHTTGMINKDLLSHSNKGLRLINFARDEIVNSEAIIDALENDKLNKYVTDFADLPLIERSKSNEDVVLLPHIGASTMQAEENCSVMAANQIINYLEHGNIKNSVNYPQIIEPMETSYRLTIANKNVSGMIGKITAIIAEEGLNIIDMKNRSRDDIAYNVIDLDSEPSIKSIEAIKGEENIINVRQING